MDSVRTWYICFRESETPHWTHKLFLKKGYSHLVAFSQTGNAVLTVDPLTSNCEFQVLWNTEDANKPLYVEAVAMSHLDKGFKVLRVEFSLDKKTNRPRLLQLLPTCVTVIKYLLGINAWCITPYQFSRYLIKNKGAVLVDEEFLEKVITNG